MHRPRGEVEGGGGGGGQLARTHLENHKFFREYTIEFNPHPRKMLDPLWNKKVQFSLKLTVDPTVNKLRTLYPL